MSTPSSSRNRMKTLLYLTLVASLISTSANAIIPSPYNVPPSSSGWRVVFQTDEITFPPITITGQRCASDPDCVRTYNLLASMSDSEGNPYATSVAGDVNTTEYVVTALQLRTRDARCNLGVNADTKQTTSKTNQGDRYFAAANILSVIRTTEGLTGARKHNSYITARCC